MARPALALLLLWSSADAAPLRATGQGLLPLPIVSRCFIPAGLVSVPGGPWPSSPLGAAPSAPASVPAAALAGPAASAPGPAAPGAAAEPAAAALDGLSAASADPKSAPAAAAQAFDGARSRRQWDPPEPPPPGMPAPALPAGALPLPIVRQSNGYSCGAAVLLAILYYWQLFDGPEEDLYEPLGTTPEDGTAPWKIADTARSFGLRADLRERQTIDDLRAGLARGETVVVDFQAWTETPNAPSWPDTWEDGHYAVVSAIDDHYVYLMDPSAGPGYTYIPIAEFLERWHDYETTESGRVETRQLAIYIKGGTPLSSFPGPLIRGR
jgi:predicted double-glycine peptidase